MTQIIPNRREDSLLPITVIGLWTLARANLSLGDLRGRAETP